MKTLIFALFILVSQQSHAQYKRFNDWQIGVTDEGIPYASTINRTGDMLMKKCDLKDMTCTWIKGVVIPCTGNDSAPALFNSPSGADMHKLYCMGSFQNESRTYYRYGIGDPDAIDSLVKSTSGILGIAVPLESGQFNVTRFSLFGAKQALDALDELFRVMAKKTLNQTGSQRM